MNPDLTARIERVKAECRKVIELGEKATPGPWDNEAGPYVYARIPGGRPNGEYILQVTCVNGAGKPLTREQNTANAAFIAQSRTFSPAAARALLVAIEGLEVIAYLCQPDVESCRDPESANDARETLTEICNQFDHDQLPQ